MHSFKNKNSRKIIQRKRRERNNVVYQQLFFYYLSTASNFIDYLFHNLYAYIGHKIAYSDAVCGITPKLEAVFC